MARPIHRFRPVAIAAAALLAAALCIAAPTTTPTTAPAAHLWDVQAMDVAGHSVRIGKSSDKAAALVFLGTDCPISIAAIPELNRLAAKFSNQAQIFGVISDTTVTRTAAAKFITDYKPQFPILFDASSSLADALHPAVTPEVFVVTPAGNSIAYHGRIDDSFADLGKPRAVVTSHDLESALTAVLHDKPVSPAQTTPVGCTITAPKPQADRSITYARDIAPILNASCVECHRDGQVAPFALTNYTDASKRADMLAHVTDSRYMPPWKPEPGYGHFLDDKSLEPHDIELLAAWAKAGAPQGSAADLPMSPTFPTKWALGQPDRIIKVKKPVKIPASGPDLFEAAVIPLDNETDQFLLGFEYHPGARRVVHHMIGFLDDSGAAREVARTKGDGETYTSFGGPGFVPTGSIGGWAPGAEPHLLTDGIARIVRKGSDLVIQTHYHPDGKPEEDQAEIGLYFAKSPPRQILVGWVLGTRLIDIPAGDSHYVRTSEFTTPIDITMRGITPHMHLIGRDMKTIATLPGGKVIPLIWIKDWDFNWQGQYTYAEPIKLPAGTVLSTEAIYDNSTSNPRNPNNPPKEVTYGEQTTNEMCFCFLNFTLDHPADMEKFRALVQALRARRAQ